MRFWRKCSSTQDSASAFAGSLSVQSGPISGLGFNFGTAGNQANPWLIRETINVTRLIPTALSVLR